MKYAVYSADEWLYPDSEMTSRHSRSISIPCARGSYAGCQILFNGVPEEAPIAWTCKGHNNHLLGDSLEVYQLIDVQVNENMDVDVSTLPAGTPAPSYVTRQAPFRIYIS